LGDALALGCGGLFLLAELAFEFSQQSPVRSAPLGAESMLPFIATSH
jgi:hypothetical protein